MSIIRQIFFAVVTINFYSAQSMMPPTAITKTTPVPSLYDDWDVIDLSSPTNSDHTSDHTWEKIEQEKLYEDTVLLDQNIKKPLTKMVTDCYALTNNLTAPVNRGAEILLHHAAKCGDITKMRALIDLGVPIDTTDEKHKTPLHRATSSGHCDAVIYLLAEGAHYNAVDQDNQSVLDYATARGDDTLIKILLAWGAHRTNDTCKTNTCTIWERYNLFNELYGGEDPIALHSTLKEMVNAIKSIGILPYHNHPINITEEDVATFLLRLYRKNNNNSTYAYIMHHDKDGRKTVQQVAHAYGIRLEK